MNVYDITHFITLTYNMAITQENQPLCWLWKSVGGQLLTKVWVNWGMDLLKNIGWSNAWNMLHHWQNAQPQSYVILENPWNIFLKKVTSFAYYGKECWEIFHFWGPTSFEVKMVDFGSSPMFIQSSTHPSPISSVWRFISYKRPCPNCPVYKKLPFPCKLWKMNLNHVLLSVRLPWQRGWVVCLSNHHFLPMSSCWPLSGTRQTIYRFTLQKCLFWCMETWYLTDSLKVAGKRYFEKNKIKSSYSTSLWNKNVFVYEPHNKKVNRRNWIKLSRSRQQ